MSATELAIIETGRKNHDNNEGGKNESNNENNSLTQAEKERLAINERRSRVASLLAQSRNESEIAEIVGVNQSTVSRDIQALKEDSRKYSEDLAKSVVIFWNQQSSRGVDEVKRRLWDIVNSNHGEFTPRDKLVAYRLIMIAEETKFRLLDKGPLLLSHQSLEEKVKRLEQEANAAETEEEE